MKNKTKVKRHQCAEF